jgi:hypothetical protein
MMLIDLPTARAQIRSDDTFDDALVTAYILAVSSAIVNYVDISPYVDSTGEIPVDSNDMPIPELPEDWNLACMIEVARMYRFRENDAADHIDKDFGYGYPFGKTAIGLLFPYRIPGLA